jgi:hypothetical protein
MALTLRPIVDALLRTPYAKPYKDEYVYVKCPLCGDSTKHHDKPHCSIWIKPGQPLIYHCWICDESGIVTANFLEQLGIRDLGLYNQVSQYNRGSMNGIKRTSKFKLAGKELDFAIPKIQDNESSQKKLAYIRSRLGINFTLQSLEALRVVFKLTDYIFLNNVGINEDFKKQMYYLNKDCIGFVSSTKDMVNLRNITPDPKIRYIKYPLYQGQVIQDQMYMIPTGADIYAKSVDLHIAEGPFDILGIFFHVKKCDCNNQLYAAVGGSGYVRAIQAILRKGFNTNMNVWIYSDKDKPIQFYHKLIMDYRPWVNSIHILYNSCEGEKDFGVTKDRIIVTESIAR